MNKQQLDALLTTTRPLYLEPRLFGLSRWTFVGMLVAGTVILVALQ
jgi:hypothetical protein